MSPLRDLPLLGADVTCRTGRPSRRSLPGRVSLTRCGNRRSAPRCQANYRHFGHRTRAGPARPAMRVSRKLAPGSAAISASTTAAAGLLHRLTENPPIRPISARRRPKRWRR